MTTSRTAWLLVGFGLALAVLSSTPLRAQSLDPRSAVVTASLPDRLLAVRTLCELGDWEGLRPALLDQSARVRHLAVSCWPIEATTDGLDLVAALSRDSEPAVRAAVAARLGQSDQMAHWDWLLALLDDPDPVVRRTATQSFPAPPAADAAALLEQLGDPDVTVAATAAQRVRDLGLDEQLSAEQRAGYVLALSAAQQIESLPELVGATTTLRRRLDDLVQTLRSQPPDPLGCSTATLAGLESTAKRIDELTNPTPASAVTDRFGQLLVLEREIRTAAQAHDACLEATPLAFEATGGLANPNGVSQLVLGEVANAWDANFGLLRSDLPNDPQGGELWVLALLGVDLSLPAREAAADPASGPSIDVSGRLRRDQLFKYDELSGWAGGGWVQGRLPFGCRTLERCRLSASVLAARATGDDDDYPVRLVAGHRRYTGDVGLMVPFPNVVGNLVLDVGRTRYEEPSLDPAGLDTAGARLSFDSPFQVELAARRNVYASTGPTQNRDDTNASLDRDHTLLDALLGVRFGSSGNDTGLELTVMGGMSFPLLDDFAPEIDPQLLFRAVMVTQRGSNYDGLNRLRLGGTRVVQGSTRDFAIQATTESFLDFTYQGLDLPDSGVRFHARIAHQLTRFEGPLTAERPELDINVIEGRLATRFVVSEWIGIELADTFRAIRFTNRDFEVSNRFLVSLFVPFGDFGLGREQELPW